MKRSKQIHTYIHMSHTYVFVYVYAGTKAKR